MKWRWRLLNKITFQKPFTPPCYGGVFIGVWTWFKALFFGLLPLYLFTIKKAVLGFVHHKQPYNSFLISRKAKPIEKGITHDE
jgi:hypothetical protein